MRIKWSRLLSAPNVTAVERDGEISRLSIEGIVCDEVCARRTERALAAMPGVRSAHVDFEAGTAVVAGAAHDPRAYDAAIRHVVAGHGLRRLIQRIARLRERRG
ncbi:MAG TPA: heavy metal-associated domain-containing protein [Dehalococcoidia bacterium]|nr:heavy metal-associated domain-containing protein [Dehalococcoidia bacterium]